MTYNYQPQNLNSFIRNNFSYFFGSIANVYAAFLQRKDIEKPPLYKVSKSKKGELLKEISQSPFSLPEIVKEIEKEARDIALRVYQNTEPYEDFTELDQALLKRQKEEKKERKIGRYFASELYQIISGKIPPEQYLNPPEPTIEDLRKMYWGTCIDAGLKELFGQKEEKKYEIKINDEITIICKTDLEFDEGIVEIKTRQDINNLDYLPVFYEPQCLAYMFAKALTEMRLYILGWAFSRKRFDVKFDLQKWQNIVERLKDYHLKVKNANVK